MFEPSHSLKERNPLHLPAGPLDSRVEDYLDHVCAPLVGLVPYARRQELRAELRGHLEALVATHEELGSERDAAIPSALRQFGPPRMLSRQWAREWVFGSSPPCGQALWTAMRIALRSFGLATLLGLALLWISAVTFVRIPDSVESFALLAALPLSAGLATGLRAPARHALGTFYALAVILPVMALTFCPLVQPTEPANLISCGGELAVIQLLFWVPLGWSAAVVGGFLRTRRSLRPRPWVLQ